MLWLITPLHQEGFQHDEYGFFGQVMKSDASKLVHSWVDGLPSLQMINARELIRVGINLPIKQFLHMQFGYHFGLFVFL